MTPISIFYLISNHEKYERAYQLFYYLGENQGLFMEYSKLTQLQQSYLLDLILSPLNLMVISDAVKASNLFSTYFKQLFVEQLN